MPPKPISVQAKRLLLAAMKMAGVTQAELARRMVVRPQTVTRIVDLEHTTNINTVQAALQACGYVLHLSTVPIAPAVFGGPGLELCKHGTPYRYPCEECNDE